MNNQEIEKELIKKASSLGLEKIGSFNIGKDRHYSFNIVSQNVKVANITEVLSKWLDSHSIKYQKLCLIEKEFIIYLENIN